MTTASVVSIPTIFIPTPLSPMIVVAGPTASGKSRLALALAKRFGGEIISCDSVAVYREFELGTAKPSLEERARIPHHLIDVAAPEDNFTAGDFSRLARVDAREITSRGKLPIVCGGTGLYLRAMLEGLFAGPGRDEALRERLRRATRPNLLWRLLRRLDAEAARRIHANDHSKLIRAIEVSASTRRPITELQGAGSEPLVGYRVLKLGLAPGRDELYARINLRCEQMFAAGLVEETRGIVARHGQKLFALRALGYRQAMEELRGECTPTEAIARAQQGHRNYAKRQWTWFRRDVEMQWLDGFGEDVLPEAEKRVREFLPGAES
jgi:tRNA dimethylallyltransferase